jgi:RNA recognition motif-containing protein
MVDAGLINSDIPIQRSTTRSFTELKLTPVILVCIHNVNSTPITHDLLHTVFSTYGNILRILIFEKTKKWKAFVEYSDSDAALQARSNLDDFLLFSDGTRMNIYPSNLQAIKFQNNNSGGIDYTLLDDQPIFSCQNQTSLLPSVKKMSDDCSNGLLSPLKKNSEHLDEAHNKSTSAESRSNSHSGQGSIDDDKEDEILKMIDDHTQAKTQQEEEELQSEDENEKDGFIENAFFSFKPSKGNEIDPQPSISTWQPTSSDFSFFNNSQPSNPKLNRVNNSYSHLEFNQNTFQSVQQITRAETFHELPSFNSMSNLPHFNSSNNLPPTKNSGYQAPPGMGTYKMRTQLNPRFPSQPELSMNSSEETQNFGDNESDLLMRIISKIQSPEFQEYSQIGQFDLGNLSQMNKESLLQLYTNLSAIVGKDSEVQKSAVLHVNGLENKDIKVQMLYNIFSNFGNIAKIIFMRNKASALIEFESIEYSSIAKDYLNNIVFMGKPLRINYSNYPNIQIRNKQNKGSEEVFMGNQKCYRFNKNKNISINPPSSVLHISNLVKDLCKDQSILRAQFSGYGKVEGLKFIFGDNGKNMCLLKMPSIEDALRAMAYLHDTELGGRRIQISFTRSKI